MATVFIFLQHSHDDRYPAWCICCMEHPADACACGMCVLPAEIGEGKLFAPGNLRATFDNPAYERLISHYLGEKYTLRYTRAPALCSCTRSHTALYALSVHALPSHNPPRPCSNQLAWDDALAETLGPLAWNTLSGSDCLSASASGTHVPLCCVCAGLLC